MCAHSKVDNSANKFAHDTIFQISKRKQKRLGKGMRVGGGGKGGHGHGTEWKRGRGGKGREGSQNKTKTKIENVSKSKNAIENVPVPDYSRQVEREKKKVSTLFLFMFCQYKNKMEMEMEINHKSLVQIRKDNNINNIHIFEMAMYNCRRAGTGHSGSGSGSGSSIRLVLSCAHSSGHKYSGDQHKHFVATQLLYIGCCFFVLCSCFSSFYFSFSGAPCLPRSRPISQRYCPD